MGKFSTRNAGKRQHILRHRRFHDLPELNQAIRELLVRLNDRPFRKRDGSRSSGLWRWSSRRGIGCKPNVQRSPESLRGYRPERRHRAILAKLVGDVAEAVPSVLSFFRQK
jgi:hypothetical protein